VRADRILRRLVETYHEDNDPRWLEAILAVCWPVLEAAFTRRSFWDPDPDELWANLLVTFLEVVRDLDPRETRGVLRTCVNRTCTRTRDAYRRRRRENRLLDSLEDLLEQGAEARLLRSGEEGRAAFGGLSAYGVLRHWRDAGWITEREHRLLRATRLDGWTVAEYARHVSEDPQTVLKRRQRVEARLRDARTPRRRRKRSNQGGAAERR
jgi:hypothetical protein